MSLSHQFFQVSMRNGLRMSDFTITIDLDCSSPEYKTPSVFMINFEFIEFVFEISKLFSTKEINTKVTYFQIGKTKTSQFPNNAYTEIIAKELNFAPLKDKFIGSLIKWSVVFQQLFSPPVEEIKFPELCYYCP